MEFDFKKMHDEFYKDEEFEEFVNNKCNNAVIRCKEYLEKEYSNEYSDEELSNMRENLIYKDAWFSATQLVITYMKMQ